MSIGLEEITARQKQTAKSFAEMRVNQLKIQAAVGREMSELTGDPRFEVWGRHIEELKKSAEATVKRTEMDLLGPYLPPDKYGAVKIEHANATGRLEAYKTALLVAKSLIETGEKAEKSLQTPAKESIERG